MYEYALAHFFCDILWRTACRATLYSADRCGTLGSTAPHRARMHTHTAPGNRLLRVSSRGAPFYRYQVLAILTR